MNPALKLLLGLYKTNGGIPTYHLVFDGTNDVVTVTADASIDDLPGDDFTVDFVAKSMNGAIADKSDGNAGWQITGSNNKIGFYASFDSSNDYRLLETDSADFTAYHHYECVFRASGRAMDIFIDGVEATYSTDEASSTGSYDADAAFDLRLFSFAADDFNAGNLRWFRISDIARHTEGFTPPSLTVAPAADANTVLLLALDEGTGTPADTSGNENVVALDGATWAVD